MTFQHRPKTYLPPFLMHLPAMPGVNKRVLGICDYLGAGIEYGRIQCIFQPPDNSHVT